MAYTFYELVWFYFIYSFFGWCIEVGAAAVHRKRFINRGIVIGPLCPIYGTGAVAFALFLPELEGNPFFLFLGGMILASFIEFVTGSVLEKIFHKKWWDYSKEKFNFEGYICLKFSAFWGICAVVMIYFINELLQAVILWIPHTAGVILAWALSVVLAADFLETALALLGMKQKMKRVARLAKELKHASRFLENAITARIEKHMFKAFPEIEEGNVREKEKPQVFAEGCGFYKLAGLFFIGAFLGDITETLFCLITTGKWMSRSSVVYGPFSVVWGLGCVLLTAILYRYRDKNDRHIFAAGVVLGGAYEYICSVFTELVFGTVFWDYSGFAFNLGGRINLLYCLFWGIAAVIWLKIIYPKLSDLIEKIPMKAGKIIFTLLIVFMIFNGIMSSLALARYTERNTAEQPEHNIVTEFLDERFTNERMERIYPNAKIVP